MINYEEIISNLVNAAQQLGGKLLYALIVLIVGLKLTGYLVKFIGKSKLMSKFDKGVKSFAQSFVKFLMYIMVFLCCASILGIPTTSFVTMLASAGVAIGLALQGALSNFAGGLILLIFKPFKIGDYVEAGGESGTVYDVNVFYTVLTTPDNKRITLPNGTLTNSNITNYSSEPTRRVDFSFSVDYGSDIEAVKKILISAANAHALVLKDPAADARLNTYADSSLNFHLRVWCNSADYWTVYFDLNEQIKKELDLNGINIPYPQLDLHIRSKEA